MRNHFLFAFLFFSSLCSNAQVEKSIVITIDDLPSVTITKSDSIIELMTDNILSTLSDKKVPAIGFVNEGKLGELSGGFNKNKLNFLEKWLIAGMDLGNHTNSHMDYNSTSQEMYFEDILKGEKYIRALAAKYNKELKYFRHPYLHRGDTKEKVAALEAFLAANSYTEAPVTIDNSEYIFARAYELALKDGNAELAKTIGKSYVSYMMENIRYFEQQSEKLAGRQISQILLIHANILNGDYLGSLLSAIDKEGYKFISMHEALEDSIYMSEDKFVTRSGISWIHRWAISRGETSTFFSGQPHCPDYVQKIAGITE
jgi:peptidoglycan/xylan/chitin deacetylase (PgdA/CDA1 family)